MAIKVFRTGYPTNWNYLFSIYILKCGLHYFNALVIGRTSAYIGATGSHYQFINDLTQPIQPMNHELEQRQDRHTANSMPYSLRLVCGLFNVPQDYEK